MSLLLYAHAIRAIEATALAAGANLMERAGCAAAASARAMLRDAARHPARVLVLAGPGNNGGDAFEAAVHLRQSDCAVTLCFAADPARLPADAARAHAKWCAAGGVCLAHLPASPDFDLVIDGLFGIGLARPVAAPYSDWIIAVNAARLPVLALDAPSGLNADTGAAQGPCLSASRTLTFIADKPGLHTLGGPDHAGTIEVAALDLRVSSRAPSAPPDARDAPQAAGRLITRADFAALLAPRARNVHKGSFGTLGILGGADGMTGAALLAGRAALKLGAGKVRIGLLDARAPAVDMLQPELMLRAATALDLTQCSTLVCGPGLGTSGAAHTLLAACIAAPLPLLLDADALNLVAGDAALEQALAQRPAVTLLTPHPQEAARLLQTATEAVQHDRIGAACALATRYRALVVLKGAGSVVAAPAGVEDGCRWWINPSGNPGMASAGMGDVLAGLAGALLAQFSSGRSARPLGTSASQADVALQSLVGAVFLHGAAADFLADQGIGPAGLTASEVIDAARILWNQWCAATPD